MGCIKVLRLDKKPEEACYPFNSAVYVPSMSKILATCDNYVVKCNASTGVPEDSESVTSPMHGPMYISLISGIPAVAAAYNRGALPIYGSNSERTNADIFYIDTTTLQATGQVGIAAASDWKWSDGGWGPLYFLQIGNFIWFTHTSEWLTTHLTSISTFNLLTSVLDDDVKVSDGWIEQFSTDGAAIYYPNAPDYRTCTYDPDVGSDYSRTDDVDDKCPIGTEYVSTIGKAYSVCGSKWLVRINDFWTEDNTYYDMEGLGASSGFSPVRLRFNAADGKIYIPCTRTDGVLVFDPSAETAVWKSGFSSPVDVVFTPSKKFAVQVSATGLKEIV